MVSYDHEPPAQQHHSSSGDPFIFGRRSGIMAQPSSSSTSSSSMPVGYHARHHQQNQPPRDEQPRPYQGPSAPFPLPTNKRSLGGLAALDEHEGANVMKSLFGEGRAQPAPLGKTRCYWALLSYHSSADNPYDMTFVYCDPVLQSHLGTEADHMLGKSFFDFVHPSEKDRAKDDLQNIVSSRTLFGSVTRCRYWRVPAIRKFFGNPNPPIAPESHMYVEDDLYLPIDVVLNMVGDSLALCFFHAIINKSIMDNSETDKTDWTNWCGTARELFDIEQCNKLWSSVVAQQLNKRRQDEPAAPPYVFQILSMPHAPTAAPGSLSPSSSRPNESPEILFSWPPPRLYRQEAAVGSRRDEEHFHQAFEDGSYFADDFAGLAVNVQASPSARTEDGSTARNGDPGTIQDGTNTSCTRRFRAKHTLTSEGMLRAVESVLVPYGSIMFACFSTTYQQTIQHQQNRSIPNWAHHTDHALTQTPQSLSIGADGPPRKKTRDLHHSPPVPSTSSLQTPSHWISAGNSGSVNDAEGSSYFPHSHLPRLRGHGHSTDASTSSDDQQPAERPYWPRPPSPDIDSKDGVLAQVPTSSSNSRPMEIDLANSTDPVIMQATAAASLFAEINPETGEKRCTSCGTSNSPEWRKGPTGQKTLCNACGLRFSRSINRQSKKEEKARKQAAAQQAAIDVLEGRAVMKQKQSGKGAGGTNTSMSLPAAQALYAQQALAGEQPFYTGIAQARPSEPSAREGAGRAGSGHQQHHSHDGTMPPHGHHDARAATAHHSHPSVTHHHEHQHQGAYMLHQGPPTALSHAHQQPHQHNQQHQQPMNGFGMAPHSQGHGPLHPPFRPY